jgi:hypothetical protein
MKKDWCAPPTLGEPEAWALYHFGGADLGDQRRSKDSCRSPR